MANQNMELDYNSANQTLVGTKKRTLIDEETGERLEVDQIVKRIYGQKQFWKLYLIDFLQILGILESRQVDVLIYVLENTNPGTNLFIGTWKKIEENLKISHGTVSAVFKKLQEAKFLLKIQNGVWQVSPHIMLKGNDHKKKLLIEYFEEHQPKTPLPSPQGGSESNEML